MNLDASARSLANVEESAHSGVSVTRTGAVVRRSASGATREPELVLILGLSLAVIAFLFHGLLDSFLAFTPTALLLWMLLGMLLAQKPQVSGR